MMKKVIGLAVLALGLLLGTSGMATASGFGAGLVIGGSASGFAGSGSGYSESATTGGSMAQGNVNNTGFSAQHSSNIGGGFSGAGASVTPDGVFTTTIGGSDATNFSAGIVGGQAGGTTSGAVGTDFSSSAFGEFHTGGFGGQVQLGGGFGSFTW